MAITRTGTNAANYINGANPTATDFILRGLLGNDTYVVDSNRDQVVEGLNRGIDTVRLRDVTVYTLPPNVENLLTEDVNVNAIYRGNILDNVINGRPLIVNFVYDAKLYGFGGNDKLYSSVGDDYLDGGQGADTMVGGRGDDTYIVDSLGDVVVEFLEVGLSESKRDLVRSSVTYTLPGQVEQLQLTGTRALNGTGNQFDNVLKGNSAINVFDGQAGRDVLDGAGGADRFVYNQISDSERISALNGGDTIENFRFAEGDRIDFRSFDPNPNTAFNDPFRFLGNGDFTGAAGEIRWQQSTGGVILLIDVDGGGFDTINGSDMIITLVNSGTPIQGWFML
ncbi:MAG: hypothetical protein NW216_06585 [Hyphomicrobium sp.]|nr:hypothetical protein [Hyphomicrobium sp.]